MKRIKTLLAIITFICIITGLTGCAANDDYMNDVKGNLSGNSYTIYTYDNYGKKVMTTTGDKINISGNGKFLSYSIAGCFYPTNSKIGELRNIFGR